MRKRRSYRVAGNFSAGLLSPATQQRLDPDLRAHGAAVLRNFEILRDGGIRSRKPLRKASTLDDRAPRRNSVASTTPPLPATFDSRVTVADPDSNLYPLPTNGDPFLRVGFDSSQRQHPVPFMVFRGAWLREGSWLAGTTEAQRRTFEVRMQPGNVPTHTIGQGLGRWPPDFPEADAEHPEEANPYSQKVFVPGRTRRDVVVAARRGAVDWTSAELRVDPMAMPALPLVLDVGSVLMPHWRPPVEALYDLEGEYRPRLIPWPIGDADLALAVTMRHLVLYDYSGGNVSIAANQRHTWFFTERQLREMTWLAFGQDLLLLHDEFILPLRLSFGEGSITVQHVALHNLPDAPASAVERNVAIVVDGDVRVSERQPVGAPAKVAVAPTRVRVVGGMRELTAGWNDTGADGYEIYARPKAAYDAATPGMEWENVQPVVVGKGVTTGKVVGLVAGVTYAVAVRARIDPDPTTVPGTVLNYSDFTEAVFAVSSGTQLGAPFRLSVTVSPDADGLLLINWTEVQGAQGYNLYRRVGTGPETVTAIVGGKTLTSRFAGTPGTTYTFQVEATSAIAPTGPRSSAVSATAANVPLGAVTGLSFTYDDNVNGRINVSANRTAQATGYDVEISTDSGFASGVTRLSLPTPSFARTFPIVRGAFKQQHIRMRAKRLSTTGVVTGPWASITVTPRFVPVGDLTGLAATHDANVNGRISIDANDVTGATGYDVEVATDAAFTAGVQRAAHSTSTFSAIALSYAPSQGAFMQRFIRARAKRLTANGTSFGNWAQTRITPRWVPITSAPTNVRIASIGGINGIHWNWPRVAGRYVGTPDWGIEFAPQSASGWPFGIETNPSGGVPARPFVHGNGDVPIGVPYKCRVRASHEAARPQQRGPWSSTFTFTRTA